MAMLNNQRVTMKKKRKKTQPGNAWPGSVLQISSWQAAWKWRCILCVILEIEYGNFYINPYQNAALIGISMIYFRMIIYTYHHISMFVKYNNIIWKEGWLWTEVLWIWNKAIGWHTIGMAQTSLNTS
jgi:hypothetical protein